MILDKPMSVCVLVGSLREASFNRLLANALISLAPPSMKLDIIEVGQLPLYNEDLETATPPAQWTAFRQCIKAADAVLFVTPEYKTVRCQPLSRMHWMSVPARMEAASGAASLVRL